MSDSATAAVPSAPAPASTVKKPSAAAKGGSKKPRVKPAHPPTSEMVNAAIKNLKERGGSSLQAIKKYISANYKIDAEKLAPFIKKYLKSAVTSGSLVQTKGKGASGSFKLTSGEKLPTEKKAVSKTQKPKQKRTKPASKKASPAAKKSTSAAAKKKTAPPAVAKKPAGATKSKAAKSPSKAKKATKVPTKKPKAPKPKKAAAKPKSAKKTPKKK